MESNQSQPANGLPVTGKPAMEGPGSDKPNRSVVGVIDQSLVALIDRALDIESAVRENTVQLKMMESQLVQVREIPKKMEAVEKQVGAAAVRVEQCVEAFNRLWERVDTFEKSTVSKLTERMDSLESSMRQVAGKPAVWDAEMSDLRIELRRHTELFDKPQIKAVHHRHYLNWYIWVVIGVFGACAFLVTLWRGAQKDASLKARNDILWRGIRVAADSALHDRLQRLENDYDSNPENFQRVLAHLQAHDDSVAEQSKEANLKQQEADWRKQEAEQAKRELEELKKERR